MCGFSSSELWWTETFSWPADCVRRVCILHPSAVCLSVIKSATAVVSLFSPRSSSHLWTGQSWGLRVSPADPEEAVGGWESPVFIQTQTLCVVQNTPWVCVSPLEQEAEQSREEEEEEDEEEEEEDEDEDEDDESDEESSQTSSCSSSSHSSSSPSDDDEEEEEKRGSRHKPCPPSH